jgi:hypothetical protein
MQLQPATPPEIATLPFSPLTLLTALLTHLRPPTVYMTGVRGKDTEEDLLLQSFCGHLHPEHDVFSGEITSARRLEDF